MELPEIIGSIILLFSTAIILLFTLSYVIFRLKNQTHQQTSFENAKQTNIKSEPLREENIENDQLNKPVFSNVDKKVLFHQPKTISRFEIVNEKLKS